MTMDYGQFLEQAGKYLRDKLPDMDISIQTVEKLQGESYTGVNITPEGSRTGATLNLRPVFELYEEGTPLEEVLSKVQKMAEQAIHQIPEVDIRAFEDYEQMKKTLTMQAVPVEPNRELLSTIPHREMDDIAIVYRFQLDRRDDGEASVLVTNHMLEGYGITTKQLMKDAEEYAPQRNPVTIRSLGEVLAEMSGGMFTPEDLGTPPVLLATVPGAVNGAGVMGYPDFFEEAADKIGGSFYVLPSSIHEILLLPEEENMDAEGLNLMVSSVNASEVSPEEQLSDEAYHYDALTQIFEKAVSYEERLHAEREMDSITAYGTVHEKAAVYSVQKETERINVLMVEPNCRPRQLKVGTELSDLQEAVGGMIEVSYPFDEPVGLIMNENGKINGLPLNRALRDENGEIYDIVAGPFMVVGLTEDSFGSLTPEQTARYSEMFRQPELFMKMGRGIMSLPLPDDMVENAFRAEENTRNAAADRPKAKTGHMRKPDHESR